MKESQLKQATVVFNELGNDIKTEPLEGSIFDKKGKHKQTDDDEDEDLQEEVKVDPVARKRSDKKVVSEKVYIANENESNSILDTETHALDYDEQTPGTPEHEVNVTLKNAIVSTSLQERCELEFVRFISKRDSYDVKEERSKPPIGRGNNMPLISDDDKVVNESGYKINIDCTAVEPAITRSHNIRNISAEDNIVSKLNIDLSKEPATNIVKNDTAIIKMDRNNATGIDKTIVTYSASDLKVDCKKFLKGPPKTRIVHKTVSMQTRSGVMKTRAIIKSERIKKDTKKLLF